MIKLYCYVDETGQDTNGKLFIVVAVVVAAERDQLNDYLERAEKSSGIGRKKWVRAKASVAARDSYLEATNTRGLQGKVFYSVHEAVGTGSFEDLTVLAVAKAVNLYRERLGIGEDYKATVTIDGLKRMEQLRVSKSLRELGVLTKKVRGGRDESEPIIRLADRIAGLIRDSIEDGRGLGRARSQLEKQGVISRL